MFEFDTGTVIVSSAVISRSNSWRGDFLPYLMGQGEYKLHMPLSTVSVQEKDFASLGEIQSYIHVSVRQLSGET